MFNKIREMLKKKKFRLFLLGICGVILGIIVIILIGTFISTNKNSITYKDVKNIVDNGESAIIYYYNSRSSNSSNRKVKRYLNKLELNYYLYDDSDVDKDEYNDFLELVGIDKSLFGCPSIIYIKDGQMYANIINIDDTDIVKDFVDNYDLYTVK